MDLLCLCFCSVLFLLCLCARLFICSLWSPAGKGLTSWLSFVVSNCEFVTFPLVSWVRCGTCLYRFLIFASLLTFKKGLIISIWYICIYKNNIAFIHFNFNRLNFPRDHFYVINKVVTFCLSNVMQIPLLLLFQPLK